MEVHLLRSYTKKKGHTPVEERGNYRLSYFLDFIEKLKVGEFEQVRVAPTPNLSFRSSTLTAHLSPKEGLLFVGPAYCAEKQSGIHSYYRREVPVGAVLKYNPKEREMQARAAEFPFLTSKTCNLPGRRGMAAVTFDWRLTISLGENMLNIEDFKPSKNSWVQQKTLPKWMEIPYLNIIFPNSLIVDRSVVYTDSYQPIQIHNYRDKSILFCLSRIDTDTIAIRATDWRRLLKPLIQAKNAPPKPQTQKSRKSDKREKPKQPKYVDQYSDCHDDTDPVWTIVDDDLDAVGFECNKRLVFVISSTDLAIYRLIDPTKAEIPQDPDFACGLAFEEVKYLELSDIKEMAVSLPETQKWKDPFVSGAERGDDHYVPPEKEAFSTIRCTSKMLYISTQLGVYALQYNHNRGVECAVWAAIEMYLPFPIAAHRICASSGPRSVAFNIIADVSGAIRIYSILNMPSTTKGVFVFTIPAASLFGWTGTADLNQGSRSTSGVVYQASTSTLWAYSGDGKIKKAVLSFR